MTQNNVNATKIDLSISTVQVDPKNRSNVFTSISGLFDGKLDGNSTLVSVNTEYFLHTVTRHTPSGPKIHYHMVKQSDYDVLVDILGIVREDISSIKERYFIDGYNKAIKDILSGNTPNLIV